MRASISRSELFAFVRTLGGNPRDTAHIEITPQAVKVTTYLRDEEGRRVAAGDEIASEVATIAVVGDGDAETVQMRHPGIGREVDVPASAVGHHAVAGWEVVPSVGADAEPATEPTGEPEVAAAALMAEPVTEEQPKKTSPRRRASKGEGA